MVPSQKLKELIMRIGQLILLCATCAFIAPAVPAEDAKPVLKLGSQPSQMLATKVTVSNLRKSYDFYTKVIGLKEVDLPMPRPDIDDAEAASSQVVLNYSGSPADPFLCLLKHKGVAPDERTASLTWLVIKVTDL